MPIDKYQPCPCGSGKKIKFCCSADIVSDLEKIQRMLDGEQPRACLEHVNHVLEKHPGRPSLLSIKAMLETELGDKEHAEETVKTFLETAPESPVALAEQARLLAQEEKPLEAVEALQSALDTAEEALPGRIYSALGDVAVALLGAGHILAARAHLLLHASLGGERDSRSAELLMEINSSSGVPLLLRQDTRFASCDEAAPFAATFQAANELISRARWRAALEQFESLAEKHGREPSVHRNIAILRGFLGREEEATKAWHNYAARVEAESLDDAVEAEALAQLLGETDAAAPIDLLDVSVEINDLDRVMEILLASKRTPSLPVDPASLATEDSPAPKAVFSLLDRDMPESGKELTLETAPNTLCDFYVFGRETDKPARLELTISDHRVPEVQSALVELCGDVLASEPNSKVVDQTNALEEAMTWAWRLPDDTPREIRQRLHVEKQKSVILDVWPTIAQTAVDGKTPLEVQGDPKYRVRLLAAILLLELHGQENRWQFNYDELREKLGVPTADKIDPEAVVLAKVPLTRFARLDAAKLSTEQLVELFQYAAMMQAPAAMRNLGEALLERDQAETGIGRADICGVLARVSQDNAEALSWIEKARDAAVAQGDSPARWLLAELSLQIEQGNGERAQEIINRVQAKHQREPGVMQSLMNVLVRYGLIDPHAGASPRAAASASPAAAAASEGGIWTPGAGAPASVATTEPAAAESPEETKSGLWLPDMD